VPEESTTTSTDPGAAGDPNATPPVTTGVEKTPEWYEKELTRTRDEAARYRTRLRDAEAQLTGAKSQADIDAALAEMKTANAALERSLLVATVGAGLPQELRELLKGDTEAELTAHAAVLAKFTTAPEGQTPPPATLQGGLDPSKDKDTFDPAEFAKNWRSGGSHAFVSGRQ
jgi:hypothetical protein